MSVKSKLKNYGVTLKEFAKYLEVSRPTLDAYILSYEKGNKIPKEKYQLFFDALFLNEIENKKDARQIMADVNNLIKRDIKYGLLDYGTQSTDLMATIIETMKTDFKSKNLDEDIYIFINTLINSYKEEPILKKFIDCILMMNGNLSLENISLEQKIFSSNLYKLFINDKNNSLKYDEESFIKFSEYIKRTNEIKEKETIKLRKEVKKKVDEEIKKRITEEINKKVEMGLNLKDIDIDLLIKNLDLKLED